MNDALIASISSQNQAQVQSQVSTKVARKQLDAAEQQGEAAVALLQQAAQLGDALNSPGRVANNGLGGTLDARA